MCDKFRSKEDSAVNDDSLGKVLTTTRNQMSIFEMNEKHKFEFRRTGRPG